MSAVIRTHQSPNHSSRFGADIDLLCLHATVGGFKSSRDWLCNPASKVSTHYLIDRSGDIYGLVNDDRAAWHAGTSRWNDKDADAIQRGSLSIELVNANSGRDPYPRVQFEAAVTLSRELIARYRIPLVNVVRHLDIAIPYGRKTDPAGFPWAAFRARLGAASGHYRVRIGTTANVRTGPYRNKPVVALLRSGQPWRGTEVPGEKVTQGKYGTSATWVSDERGYCVWLPLLEAA